MGKVSYYRPPTRGGHEAIELSGGLDLPRRRPGSAVPHHGPISLRKFASCCASSHESATESSYLLVHEDRASLPGLALYRVFLALWNLVKTTAFFAKYGRIVGGASPCSGVFWLG